jgi:hypothetical protein
VEELVAALLREREGYVRRGLDDRVAQVDAELARLGHVVAGAEPEPEQDQEAPRRGRPRKAVR